ncbi:ABC transporter permease [Acholeplasma vituli]|uniref:ABC transporter permease n=1 Tax=Paracholeplasma vituli TaxID=69473 RepID=A0ABT2PUK0_9MOLU|nr:ABC transporter permease [Paracholeplasma vituli]MCU0104623.1 ABC transporter permease [Paracholeplasma vituli]
MIKTLLKMEFRRAIKANLLWSIGVGLMIYLIIVLYPLVDDIYSQVPPELMAIMEQFGGIPSDVLEYYATEGAMMLQLFGAIYAALLGFNLISTFEKERLAEVIYTQAIPKQDFFISKLIVLFIMILLFTLINVVIGYIGFLTINETFSLSDYVIFSLLNGVMYLHIALLCMVLALCLNKEVKAMISLAIPLPLYILSIVSTLTDNDWLKRLKYISPFTYSDPVAILKNQSDFEYVSFLVFTGVILMGLSIGYGLYKKRISVS